MQFGIRYISVIQKKYEASHHSVDHSVEDIVDWIDIIIKNIIEIPE